MLLDVWFDLLFHNILDTNFRMFAVRQNAHFFHFHLADDAVVLINDALQGIQHKLEQIIDILCPVVDEKGGKNPHLQPRVGVEEWEVDVGDSHVLKGRLDRLLEGGFLVARRVVSKDVAVRQDPVAPARLGNGLSQDGELEGGGVGRGDDHRVSSEQGGAGDANHDVVRLCKSHNILLFPPDLGGYGNQGRPGFDDILKSNIGWAEVG
jgi:hypothetical protein